MTVVMSSCSGVSKLKGIAKLTNDSLIKVLLNLKTGINADTLSNVLKKLGQNGARKLSGLLPAKNAEWLRKSKLTEITLDVDSTVKGVSGNQVGAAKGFNPMKRGAKSYHLLLVFVSEMKLLYHSWFRTGSAYTSNGIIEFLRKVRTSLPDSIEKVFFRADSGFFNGKLFDLLESKEYRWDYLVKVRNLKGLLGKQTWTTLDQRTAICSFSYKGASWKKTRKLKAIRIIERYE